MALTAKIDRNAQRTVIAKMRSVSEHRSGFTLTHDRQRKTKTRPEVNLYALVRADGRTAAVVNTATGDVSVSTKLLSA